jgi:DNA-3-methyladenine glycosylase I
MDCTWPGNDDLMLAYHQNEWGKPVHEDKKHFEFIVLDSFQAGLSWKTILYRRPAFKKAFANFDVKKVAKYTNDDLEKLMLDEGIIRNRLKISGTIKNAKAFIEIQKEFGSFDQYIWQFTKGEIIDNRPKSGAELTATSKESDEMSKALKKRGFTFVGSTICYAYMQAAGMVNDHLMSCSCRHSISL